MANEVEMSQEMREMLKSFHEPFNERANVFTKRGKFKHNFLKHLEGCSDCKKLFDKFVDGIVDDFKIKS